MRSCLFIAALSLAAPRSPAADDALANGGFEADPPTSSWTVHVFGAKPEIAADAAVAREGSRSLRISSAEPSDAALGQNLVLPAGTLWRLRG